MQAQGPQNFGQNAYSRTSTQNYHDWSIGGSGPVDDRQQQDQRVWFPLLAAGIASTASRAARAAATWQLIFRDSLFLGASRSRLSTGPSSATSCGQFSRLNRGAHFQVWGGRQLLATEGQTSRLILGASTTSEDFPRYLRPILIAIRRERCRNQLFRLLSGSGLRVGYSRRLHPGGGESA